jgi:hypothetical protein
MNYNVSSAEGLTFEPLTLDRPVDRSREIDSGAARARGVRSRNEEEAMWAYR